MKQDKQMSMQFKKVSRIREIAEQIQTQHLIQYIPFQKEINGKKLTDYYAIQYLRQYIPQHIPTFQMHQGQLYQTQTVQYLPVQTQIVHYPQDSHIKYMHNKTQTTYDPNLNYMHNKASTIYDSQLNQMKNKISTMQKLLQIKDIQLKNYQQKFKYFERQKEQQKLKKEKQQNEYFGLCKICLDKKATFINKSCGHLCLCQQHSYSLKKCPLCNKQGSFMKVYTSLLRTQ